MPFTRPPLPQLRQQARSFFASRLPGADQALRRSILNVAADVIAGLINGLYGYLDWLVQQRFTRTSSEPYLVQEAADYGLTKDPALQSTGNAVFTGLETTPIASGTIVLDPAQNQYATTASGSIASGTATLPVQAVLGGAAGNLEAGTALTLASAISGIDSGALVASGGLTGGADQESTEALRARLIKRKQQPPQGGTPDDYEEWAGGVTGVTRVWVLPLNRGPGTVDVTFVMDGRTNIIPLTGDVTAVQAVIDAKRPITDSSEVFAPTAAPVNFTFTGIAPNTTPVQNAITAALQHLLATAAEVGGGLTLQDQILPAIAGADGLTGFNLSGPSADVAGVAATIPTLGTITFP